MHTWRVVDYKTSASGSNARGKLRGPTKAKPEGGTYWRQLAFYKLLYDARPGQIRRVKSGAISFLLVNQAGRAALRGDGVTAEGYGSDQEDCEGQYGRRSRNRILRGAGRRGCAWCRFVGDLRGAVPVGLGDFGLDDPTYQQRNYLRMLSRS